MILFRKKIIELLLLIEKVKVNDIMKESSSNLSLAWKLTSDFDEQSQQLLYGAVKSDYEVDAYSCRCGLVEFIIRRADQSIDYTCKSCGNVFFNNANNAREELFYFTEQADNDTLDCSYTLDDNKDSIFYKYGPYIPSSINMSEKKVHFSMKTVHEKMFNFSTGESYTHMDKHLSWSNGKFARQCLRLIHDTSSLPHNFKFTNSKLKALGIGYFENMDYIIDEDLDIPLPFKLISNNHQEKSIHKAICDNYIKQLADQEYSGEFNPTFIHIITKVMTDPDTIVKLLNMDIFNNFADSEYPEIMLAEEYEKQRENLATSLYFLKDNHYTEAEILNFFADVHKDHKLLWEFGEAINELGYLYTNNIKGFKHVECSLLPIREEALRCAKQHRVLDLQNWKLHYSEYEKSKCTEIDNYYIKLPNNNEELYDWLEKVDYYRPSDYLEYEDTVIYGFYNDDSNLCFLAQPKRIWLIEEEDEYGKILNNRSDERVFKIWHEKFVDIGPNERIKLVRYQDGSGK